MIYRELVQKAARTWFVTTLMAAIFLVLFAFQAKAAGTTPETSKPQTQTGGGGNVIPGTFNQGTLENNESIKPDQFIEDFTSRTLKEGKEPIGRDRESRQLRIALNTDSGVAVLEGDPAIGKTEVVRQFIFDNPNYIVYRLKTEALYNLSRADRSKVLKSVTIYLTNLAAQNPEIPTSLYVENLPFLNEGTAQEAKPAGAIIEAVSFNRHIPMILETNAKTNKLLIDSSARFGELQTKVSVGTPTFDSVVAYFQRIHTSLETRTHASFSNDSLVEAARLALRFYANDPYHKGEEMLVIAGENVARDLAHGETDVRAANRLIEQMQNEVNILKKDLAFAEDATKRARLQDLTTKIDEQNKIVNGRETPDANSVNEIAELTREIARLNNELSEAPPAGLLGESKERTRINGQIAKATTRRLALKNANVSEDVAAGKPASQVGPKQVQTVAAEFTGYDEDMISMDIKDGVKRIDSIKEDIYNQDQIIDRIGSRVAAYLKEKDEIEKENRENPNKKPLQRRKPLYSLFLSGRTGTGKTDIPLRVAQKLGMPVKKIHMSTYTEAHETSGLIGARPGFVGHGTDGELTGPARRTPFMVFILDELLRANKTVIESIVYPVLDQGETVDSEGRTVYYDQAIIVAPTNAGEQFAAMEKPALIEFLKAQPKLPENLMKRDLETFQESELRSECIKIDLKVNYGWDESAVGRWDDVMSTNNHNAESVKRIADRNVKGMIKTFAKRGITVKLSEDAMNSLIASFNETEGARSIETAFKRDIHDPLFAKWGLDTIKKGDVVIVSHDEGQYKTKVGTLQNFAAISGNGNSKSQKLAGAVAKQGEVLAAAPESTKVLNIMDQDYMVHNAVAKAFKAYGE